MENYHDASNQDDRCFSKKNLYLTNGECQKTYVENLLHEANSIIVQIDNGILENTRKNRNYACWRLKRAEKFLNDQALKSFRKMTNSLWSALYRLEHAKGDEHPYIKKIRERYFQ